MALRFFHVFICGAGFIGPGEWAAMRERLMGIQVGDIRSSREHGW